jgi:hypothetical protein
MSFETLLVPRAAFDIQEPWAVPAECIRVELRRATDGASPRLPTRVAAYYDDEALTVLFSARDDDVVATLLDHDAPLWQEDVVEVFLAPAALTQYFEIEVNPLGTTFDARIDSPDGDRATMITDLGWTADGLFAAIRRDGETVDTVLRIPFASLAPAPKPGDEWRGNFFRVDRGRNGDEYSAWQPALKTPADFHVPAAFGALRFG